GLDRSTASGEQLAVQGGLSHRAASACRVAKRFLHKRLLRDLLSVEARYEIHDELPWRGLCPVLDAEVEGLPEKYRVAFVPCYPDGKTNEEAAVERGCSNGTALSQPAPTRERRRAQLAGRALALSAEPLTPLLEEHASSLAAVSPVLVNATVHTAVLLS